MTRIDRKMVGQEYLLSLVDWSHLSNWIRAEIRLRERLLPVRSAYRWWARRPSQLFGAILDTAGAVRVVDPFGGGGTIAVEAARRGLPVYVQELYPWPVFGLKTALTPVPLEALDEASRWLLEILEPLRRPYLRQDGRELIHILRVRRGKCPKCDGDIVLFPDTMISLVSRQAGENQVYYGCPACGMVWSGPQTSPPTQCPSCKSLIQAPKKKGQFRCPLCGYLTLKAAFLTSPPRWYPALVQELVTANGRRRVHLRPADPADPVEARQASEVFPQLRQPIPSGLETNRLINAGFRFWGDLYTDRQAAILLEGLRVLSDMEHPCRDHLALAVLGMAEMPAFLTRWERYHPKAVEALAHHRYAHTLLAVEINPLSPVGRGTLPRRLQTMKKVADWVRCEIGMDQQVHLLSDPSPYLDLDLESGIHLVLGSSIQMALRDRTVDLVLTDPPYHDDIQYGELARLFHFWMSFYQKPLSIREKQEASSNRFQGRDTESYMELLTRCFQECHRVLQPEGRLVFTFRNRKLAAWQALCVALDRAGFHIHALATVQTDETWDPTRKGSRSMRCDLVLECMRCEVPAPSCPFYWVGSTDEEKALMAMGLALAEALREGKANQLLQLYWKWGEQLELKGRDWIR